MYELLHSQKTDKQTNKTTSLWAPQSSLEVRKHDIGDAKAGGSSANSRTETKGGLRGTEWDRE